MDGSEETSGWARSSSASRAAGGGAFSGSIGFFRAATGCISGWDQEEEEEKEEFVREEKEKLRPLLSSSGGGSGDGGGGGDVSLREWLDRPERAVNLLECLHVFRQVVEAVGAAQEQGIVVGNVRPSCFVMSPSNRVSFIESASCSTSSSSERQGTEAPPEGPSSTTQRRDADGGSGENTTFPMKRILLMESSWYTSPEEVDGAPATFASDVFRLGVLLFEVVAALMACFCSMGPLLDRAYFSFLCSYSARSTRRRRS